MSDHWFKPRRYGYGATPTSWQGWALVVAYVGLLAWEASLWMRGPEPRVGLFLGVVLIETVALIAISRAKTDGVWRWRWGQE